MEEDQNLISRRHFAATIGSICISGCSAPSARYSNTRNQHNSNTKNNTVWPMARYNSQNTGYNPDSSPPKNSISDQWVLDTSKEGDIISTPLANNDNIFAGSVSEFMKFNISSREKENSIPINYDGGKFTSCLGDGNIYIADISSEEGQILAMDSESHSKKWETDAYIRSDLIISNGMILFKQIDNSNVGIRAIGTERGEDKWTFNSKSTQSSYYLSPPTVDDGIVYGYFSECSTSNNNCSKLYALDINNGERRWEFEVNKQTRWPAPIVYDGTVYIGHEDGITAVNKSSGTKKWDFSTQDEVIVSPAIANNKIYLGDKSGQIYSIRIDNSNKVWQITSPVELDPLRSHPIVSKNGVYFGGHEILALDIEDGSNLWSFNIDTYSSSFTQPALIGDQIIAGVCTKSEAGEYYDNHICILK